MTIPHLDEPTPSGQKAGGPAATSVDGAVHRVVVPEHWIDLIDILSILKVGFQSPNVTAERCTPPGILGALTQQIVCNFNVIRPPELCLAGVINGAETALRHWPVYVYIFHLNELLHKINPPEAAGNHQRSLPLLVQGCIFISAHLNQAVGPFAISLHCRLLQLEEYIREGVAKKVSGVALWVWPVLQWRIALIGRLSEL
mmetsp:Transcript_10768/g.18895  ORF Transcript_10768/g.18895 Transcript_10768/m.18895 type:complete len:200 (+) Transcript_10768:145-744(+)